MKGIGRNPKLFMQDILKCIKRIEEYTKDMSFEDFQNDLKTKDAVIKNLIEIGEAVSHITSEYKGKCQHIPWKKIKDFRNFLVHEYFNVDDEIIWEVVKNELSKLRSCIDRLLQEITGLDR